MSKPNRCGVAVIRECTRWRPRAGMTSVVVPASRCQRSTLSSTISARNLPCSAVIRPTSWVQPRPWILSLAGCVGSCSRFACLAPATRSSAGSIGCRIEFSNPPTTLIDRLRENYVLRAPDWVAERHRRRSPSSGSGKLQSGQRPERLSGAGGEVKKNSRPSAPSGATPQRCDIFILRGIRPRLQIVSIRPGARGDALVRCPAAPPASSR
jgi:hypothetical protein